MLDSSNKINDASHASLHNVTTCSHSDSDTKLLGSSGAGTSKQDTTTSNTTTINSKFEEQLSLLNTAFSKVKGIFTKGIGLAQDFWNTSSDKTNGDQTISKENSIINSNANIVADLIPTNSVISILQGNNTVIQEDKLKQDNTKEMAISNQLAIEVEVGSLGSNTHFETKEELQAIQELEKEKNRKFQSIKEEPIQQEKPIKWVVSGTNHLLDSYNREGEYSSLLENSKEQGYDSKMIKSNFNKKR